MTTDPNPSNKRKAEDLDLKTLPTPPRYQQDDKREGFRKLSIRAADIALDYYNKKNHSKYELLSNEALDSNNFVDHRGFWTHCCFYAKDSSIKQFFAEIHMAYLSEMDVTCMILEGKTKVGCEFCNSVIHPVDGFQTCCSKTLAVPPTHDQGNLCKGYNKIKDFPEFGKGYPECPNYDKSWREQNIRSANLVLDYYNNKNNTKFVLVEDETMASNTILHGKIWQHCSFNATEDSCTQLFFGEVDLDIPGKPVVTTCMVLEEGKTKVGCLCCSVVIHPVEEGYKVGCPSKGRYA